MEQLLHEIENNEVSQKHLKDNGQKFSRHCNIVITLLYQRKRLTARQLEREYNIDGRRLRDIYANRKECKKAWRVEGGKEIEMEYWLEIPIPPTKSEVIEKAGKVIKMMQDIPPKLETVFELPDEPTQPYYTPQTLF
jgi:hypothetical protein